MDSETRARHADNRAAHIEARDDLLALQGKELIELKERHAGELQAHDRGLEHHDEAVLFQEIEYEKSMDRETAVLEARLAELKRLAAAGRAGKGAPVVAAAPAPLAAAPAPAVAPAKPVSAPA